MANSLWWTRAWTVQEIIFALQINRVVWNLEYTIRHNIVGETVAEQPPWVMLLTKSRSFL
jgi:hypothetical protein